MSLMPIDLMRTDLPSDRPTPTRFETPSVEPGAPGDRQAEGPRRATRNATTPRPTKTRAARLIGPGDDPVAGRVGAVAPNVVVGAAVLVVVDGSFVVGAAVLVGAAVVVVVVVVGGTCRHDGRGTTVPGALVRQNSMPAVVSVRLSAPWAMA
jgi:hypothetical protein